MLALLSRSLYRHAAWRAIAALLLVCAAYFWIFNYSSLPFSNPALVAAGCGEGLLDLRPYYDASAAYRALDCYGGAGRAIYRRFLVTDMSFLFFYGAAFSLLLTRLLATLTAPASRWRAANLLPLGVALADAVEDILLFSLLGEYPRHIPALGDLAGIATMTKHALAAASLAALAGCVGTLLWRRIRS
jgi:hypothetical protein